ncbi:DUF2283 domain-containing protein [Hydrogenivirga sp. 128-5-R1-1]|uniref:DUF2283 domain-containing protein n=1 Tax=Hydrogenivirga sp. 128-5-R1-1 TaxID=392423 RepID=UPI00015F37E4|nr:DUF2283 domain-containing protein [Hydrogenivirga sp. 128-5-R1-1]EDP76426.1 hypothetical protein HG1285_02428 [Hydrogenivirga sp. 128-5-R1-1]
MKVQYFPDTDTLYIELINATSVESEEIMEDIVVDYDTRGRIVGIEIEHFTERFRDKPVDIPIKLTSA